MSNSKVEKLATACDQLGITLLSTDLPNGIVKTVVDLQCKSCNHHWATVAANLTRKRASGCPACAEVRRAEQLRLRGEERLRAFCDSLGYHIVGEYVSTHARITLRCGHHGSTFSCSPVNLYAGQRCPECSGTTQHLSDSDIAAELCADSTWKVTGFVDSGFRMECTKCGTVKEIMREHARESRRWSLERRSCNCVRYGERYRDFVADISDYELLEEYQGANVPVLHRHTVCGTEWKVKPTSFRGDNGRPTRCPSCARKGRSSQGQLEMADFVRSLGLVVHENVPGLIHSSPRQEVDIFVPSHSVAIEFDGVWWHAEGASREQAGRSRPDAQPDAVTDKTDRLAEAGIRLIRIFSDEWALRRTAVVSRLRAILGCPVEKLNARSLMVDASVPVKEALAFLDDNHVQGRIATASHVAVGLRDSEGSLVALMTFGERSTSANSASAQLELLRFCTRAGTAVRGAAGRLLSAFRENYETDHRTLVSYADIRWSGTGGAFYDVLGFSLAGRTRPSYSYIHPSHSNRRISRISLQKHKLLAANPQFDASMTERQMAEALGYARVWDSGQLRYELRLQ